MSLRRRRLLLGSVALLAAGCAAGAAVLLAPDLVARRFSADGVLEPFTQRWLGIYRGGLWTAASGLGLLAAWLFTRRSEAWIARRWPMLCRCALACATLILASIALELVARVVEEPSGRGADFATLAREFMGSVRGQLNADGMRDDSFDRPRAPGQRRVLLIGDSFAFGFGIAQREQGFAAALERELAAHGSFDVFNAGVPGADTRAELETLHALRERVDPELVLVAWHVNDAESEQDKQAYVQQSRLLPLVSDTLLRTSAAWRRLEPALVARLKPTYVEHLRRLHGQPQEAFSDLLQEAGGRAAVVLFPRIDDLERYPLQDVHARVAGSCAQRGVPCLDLLDVFRGEPAAALQASALDHHLNAWGAGRAARAMADFLAQQGVLD